MKFRSFENALLHILKPLVRIAVKRGYEVGRFVDILKLAFVEVIQDDFRVPGRKLSISRIALLSGLTRREASRLVNSTWLEGLESPRRQLNRAASVFEAWASDARFCDEHGHPAPLPLEVDEESVEPSFGELVKAHGADVPMRAILDELLRVGAVGHTRDGRIRQIENAYVPFLEEDARFAIQGSDIADLISAIDHNNTPEAGEPYFQRRVSYSKLPVDYLPELKERVRAEGEELLDRLSEEMSRKDGRVSESGQPTQSMRAMVGLYYYENEEPDETD